MRERKFWNEKVETLPIEEIRKIQEEKVKKQIIYIYKNSPFYKEKFDSFGIKPKDIKSFDDFRNLPIFLNKEEHRKCQEESIEKYGHPIGTILCAPIEKVVGVAATSGTTGNPTFYGFTKHDIKVTNEILARGFWRAGIRPGETVIHAFGMSLWVAGIPIIRALENMGARPVPVGAEAGSERLLQAINLTRPTTLLCTPSYAEFLIEKAPKVLGKEVKEFNIKRIICAGEPGAGLPNVRKKLREAYGAKIFDSAGVPYGMFNISCDCEEYHGMHAVCEDFHIMHDLVDPETKKPVEIKDGMIGERVTTAIDWEAAPPFRYAIGDIIQVFFEECECGVEGTRIKYVGRVDDMLIVKGINVFPAAIKNVISSYIPRVTGEFRIILDSPPPRIIPPLKMKVEYGVGISENELVNLKKDLEERISSLLRFRPSIEFVSSGILERSSLKGKVFEKTYEK